jgi:hypothetical protein
MQILRMTHHTKSSVVGGQASPAGVTSQRLLRSLPMDYGIYPSSFSRLQIQEANLGACRSLDGASRLEHNCLETYT